MENVYVKESQQQASACIIWMHGLGSSAEDMMGLVAQLPIHLSIRHVFVNAPIRPVTINNRMPMRAWYDIIGVKLTDREDITGISASELIIQDVIQQQISTGLQSHQIFLAGFSQGGAMALYAGLRFSPVLGGVIALSAYLPLVSECDDVAVSDMPIFVAGGSFDPVVLPAWTKQSYDWLRSKGFQYASWHEYPMEHTICGNEIKDLTLWLNTRITSFSLGKGSFE